MVKRLWEKGETLESRILEFTVGNDPIIDLELVEWDCIGSAAHTKMLQSINLLTKEEANSLLGELASILKRSRQRDFTISQELEDCHSAIEAELTNKLGDTGKKIHTGRSRNDQVILAMRLYLRNQVLEKLDLLNDFAEVLENRISEIGDLEMPGYTHMQAAMPSSIGMWLHAFLEATLDLMKDGIYLLNNINTNPLGSAAGFGTPLNLDRELTAELLGFLSVQRSVIDVQNSRGRFSKKVLRWGEDISSLLEKLACDLILYSTKEYGFFSLPRNCTTGSSIMPQKHNPDVLELTRSRASRVRGALTELISVISKLPSNYHRDFQYTKEPVFRGLKDVKEMLEISAFMLKSITPNEKNLKAAISAELYATYDAFRRVQSGTPFREAYKQTAEAIESGEINVKELKKDFSKISAETTAYISEAKKEHKLLDEEINNFKNRFQKITKNLFIEI